MKDVQPIKEIEKNDVMHCMLAKGTYGIEMLHCFPVEINTTNGFLVC